MEGIGIFLPVLTHCILVMSLFVLLLKRKSNAVSDVDLKATALNNKAWPVDVVKVSNNIANQFETPIVFYVLCVTLFLVGGVNAVTLSLAWTYVLVRYVHAYFHVGANHVPYRMRAFTLSILLILALLVSAFYSVISQL